MTTEQASMQRSWLIQRLHKATTRDNPFSFGGGLKNGGLSDDAMSILRDVFSFDYMGAAEFEFGEVPKALQGIAGRASNDDLTAWTFSIALRDVAPNWQDKSNAIPEGDATIYVLCPGPWRADVEERIRGWAAEDFNRELKEATHLASTLRPFNEFDGSTVGWLELNNGFMFFTDEAMWQQTAAIFGVEVAS